MLYILLQSAGAVPPDQKTSPWWFFGTVIIIISIFLIDQCMVYEIHLSKLHKYLFPLSPERCRILEERFYYYNKLSEKDQGSFRKRVHHFLVNKNLLLMKDLK